MLEYQTCIRYVIVLDMHLTNTLIGIGLTNNSRIELELAGSLLFLVFSENSLNFSRG